jgi:hypothetical protein
MVRFIPQSDEDQAAFTGANGSGLGEETFSLWREQLTIMGVDPNVINDAFGENDRLDYFRDIMNSGSSFVPPLTGVERRVDDPLGNTGMVQDIHYMCYARVLNDGTHEFLIITTERIKEQNSINRRGIHVDFCIGTLLDTSRVNIL